MITDLKDINSNYERFIRNLAEPRPKENRKRDAKTKMEDYFKNFRTRVVLCWLFSNLLVIVALSNTAVLDAIQQPLLLNPNDAASKTGSNVFLQFIFWSVFGLAIIRFIGSITYLVLRALRG
jgi:chitin synthase